MFLKSRIDKKLHLPPLIPNLAQVTNLHQLSLQLGTKTWKNHHFYPFLLPSHFTFFFHLAILFDFRHAISNILVEPDINQTTITCNIATGNAPSAVTATLKPDRYRERAVFSRSSSISKTRSLPPSPARNVSIPRCIKQNPVRWRTSSTSLATSGQPLCQTNIPYRPEQLSATYI